MPRAGKTGENVLLFLTRAPLFHESVTREYDGLSQQLDAMAVEEEHREDVDLSPAAAPSKRSCKRPRSFEKAVAVVSELLE